MQPMEVCYIIYRVKGSTYKVFKMDECSNINGGLFICEAQVILLNLSNSITPSLY